MNSIVFAIKHPMQAIGRTRGGALACRLLRVDPFRQRKILQVPAFFRRARVRDPRGSQSAKESMKTSPLLAVIVALISLSLPAFRVREEQEEAAPQKIVVTSPKEAQDIILTQEYVCQIHSQKHINVRAMQSGYITEIRIKEGQAVKEHDLMFKIIPVLFEAKLKAEEAEAQLAEIKLQNTERLHEQKVVSLQDVLLHRAELARAKAKVKLAQAELKFTEVTAPFDGIVDKLHEQLGSLIKERDILTTLSDNSLMWVYFNVPEKQYIEYKASSDQEKAAQRIELKLANGTIFKYPGNFQPDHPTHPSGAIEAKFNNETGTVPFRADFQNPDRLLRHGMTGNILVHRPLKNAIVIPQRATYEILERLYVFVVDKDNIAHQREIVKEYEMPNIFIIKKKEVSEDKKIVKGVGVDEKIIFEGARQVHDGQKVEYEYRSPAQILGNQTFHAE